MSPWLDDGNTRQYLNEIDRLAVDFDFTPPPATPPVDIKNIDFSTIPPSNGVVSPDIVTMVLPPSNGVVDPDIATMVLPTRQKDRHEQS